MTTPTVAFKAVTPNLIVRDIERSRRFYCDVLGFAVKQTVPDTAPFVFVWLERGEVTVFLNDPGAVAKDVPSMAAPVFGGTATLFVIVEGVDALLATVAPKVPLAGGLAMPVPDDQRADQGDDHDDEEEGQAAHDAGSEVGTSTLC